MRAGRDESLDTVRGLMILGVLATHIAGVSFSGMDLGEAPGAAVEQAIRPVLMPVAFALAGFTAIHTLYRPLRRSLRDRVQRLLWPWFIWSGICVILMVLVERKVDGFSISVLLRPLTSPGEAGPTWFLITLFVLDAGLRLGRRIPPWLWFTGAVIIESLIGWAALPVPDQAMFAAPYFAGLAVAAYWPEPWNDRLSALSMTVLLGACAAGPLLVGRDFQFTFIAAAPVCAAVIVVLRSRHLLDTLFGSAGMRRLGRDSLVVYLGHWPGVIIAARLLAELDVSAATPRVVIAAALTIGSALLFLGLQRRLPAVRWLFEWPLSTPHSGVSLLVHPGMVAGKDPIDVADR